MEWYQLCNEGDLYFAKRSWYCFPWKFPQNSPRPIPWIDHTGAQNINSLRFFSSRHSSQKGKPASRSILWLLKRVLIHIHPPSESGYLKTWGNAQSIRSSLVKAFQTPWATRPSEDWMLMLGGQPQFQFRVNFDVGEPLNIHYLLGQVTAPPRMPHLW